MSRWCGLRLRQVVPLFLAAQGNGVQATARMHALVQLAQNATDWLPDTYLFQRDRDGFSSPGLEDDLRELARKRLILETDEDAGTRYAASPEGFEFVRRIMGDRLLSAYRLREALEVAASLHRAFAERPLKEVLAEAGRHNTRTSPAA